MTRRGSNSSVTKALRRLKMHFAISKRAGRDVQANGVRALYGRARDIGEPIGICGLIKREGLKDVDLGFAFLPRFWRNGYAFESASAVMCYGRKVLGLRRIVAILSPDNHRSSRLLEKLGFCFESTVKLQPDDEELKLYAIAR